MRLAQVNGHLADSPEQGSVTIGLAELRSADSPEDLVARADNALYRERHCRRDPEGSRTAPPSPGAEPA